jgi:serine protease AprX
MTQGETSMTGKMNHRRDTTGRAIFIAIFLTIAMLMQTAATAIVPQVAARDVAPVIAAPGKVQPRLLEMAASQPDAMMEVIVQKTGADRAVEALIPGLGGAITKDLHIINAFAALLPAKAIPQLATAPGVRWISLDAPVTSTNAPSADLTFSNTMVAVPLMIASSGQVTVSMLLTASRDVVNVTPSPLTVTGANGASAILVSGPTPASATVGPAGRTFTWVYLAYTGGSDGQLTFRGNATAGGAIWPSAQSNSITVQAPPPPTFTTWATLPGAIVATSFNNALAMTDSPNGPNETYGYGANVKGGFTSFTPEITPGYAISKIEVVLRAYVTTALSSGEDLKLRVYVGGSGSKDVTLNHQAFDDFVGAANAGTIYVNVTGSRKPWLWGDFNNGLEVTIDQSRIKTGHYVNYDAIGLRVTTTSGTDTTGDVSPTSLPKQAVNTSKLLNVYDRVVRATDVWNEAPGYLQGQGMTVAVVDSGIVKNSDLGSRLIKSVNFNAAYHDANDRYGHGTFIAMIVGGDGKHSGGQFIGIAPKTNIINVRVSDDQGMGTESAVVAALQWILENKKRYNIRVVNLSLNSSVWQSYHTSPMDAACEILWFNGIVVVVSAGNNGDTVLYPPANDPFVITVGAMDDNGTVSSTDDVVASFSAYARDENNVIKPDLVAPGRNIVTLLGDNRKLTMSQEHPANRVNDHYFRMSGTSVAAPIVSGAVALLLQDEPGLNPDQVKYRLTATANKNWPGYNPVHAGAGLLDVYAAVHGTMTGTANTGLPASQLLWTGPTPVTWGSVNWTSVNWTSVNWTSVNWTSVNWTSVNWTSDEWEPIGGPGGPASQPELPVPSQPWLRTYLPALVAP